MTAQEIISRALMAEVFALAQPDRGDVFSWLDDRADQIAKAIAEQLAKHGATL